MAIDYPISTALGASGIKSFPKTQYNKIVEIIDEVNSPTADGVTPTSGTFTVTGNETVTGTTILTGGATNAGATMYVGFFPTTAAQALSGAGAVNVTSFLTKYTSTGAAQALSLASGTQVGQRKKVSHVVDGGSGVLTAVFVGGTTITFTTVGEFADLIWTGSAWGVLELGNTATPGTPPTLA